MTRRPMFGAVLSTNKAGTRAIGHDHTACALPPGRIEQPTFRLLMALPLSYRGSYHSLQPTLFHRLTETQSSPLHRPRVIHSTRDELASLCAIVRVVDPHGPIGASDAVSCHPPPSCGSYRAYVHGVDAHNHSNLSRTYVTGLYSIHHPESAD